MSSLSMVVQWLSHPTWYPKPLSALPKILNLSLDGRKAVGSNPTHGVQSFGGPVCLLSLLSIFDDLLNLS
jgi:hypothetical protein